MKGYNTMKVAVIDDLLECRKQIKEYLADYLKQYYTGTEPVVSEFNSGDAFINQYTPDTYDLIFLDYYMAGIDGLTTARAIRAQDSGVPIIMITTSPDHAIDSYLVRASGYLLKPITQKSFEEALSIARIDKILDGQFVELGEEKVLVRDIVWCDRDNHYVQIHTGKKGTLRFRMTFEEFQTRLAPYSCFLSCYRGCIINQKRVKDLLELAFLMDTGEQVPFRKKDRAELAKQYARFLFHQAREVG